MRIAMIGCGKLGLPVSLAWATKHDVVGYDPLPHAKQILEAKKYPYIEAQVDELLQSTTLRMVDTVELAVEHGSIVFIAVQTPHLPNYEGITRMPERREDFNYSTLRAAVRSVATAAEHLQKFVTIVVISTVLPGTCKRDVEPLLNKYTGFVYAPMFIAQSTVVPDAMKPEFVLLGVDRSDSRSIDRVREFFLSMQPAEKLRFMRVESAEATKCAYNSYLNLKLQNTNMWMEICHKTGADVDEVTSALAMATDRVISSKYMSGGMGDGGACHCRDLIALSWLAKDIDLSYDIFSAMVEAREKQTEWLADLARAEAVRDALPIVILGKSYKKGTNLTVGSPAILLKNILDEWKIPGVQSAEQWDPYIDPPKTFEVPSVFVVAADHDEFFKMTFPKSSVVIDPWGKLADQEGVKVVRVGRR